MQEPVNTAMLGLGLKYKTQFGKLLPVPFWIYEHLERWHYLSFLKTRKNIEVLRQIHFQALEPPMIEALIELIDRDLGYYLYASIEQSKCALSETSSTRFRFSDGKYRRATLPGSIRSLDSASNRADQ